MASPKQPPSRAAGAQAPSPDAARSEIRRPRRRRAGESRPQALGGAPRDPAGDRREIQRLIEDLDRAWLERVPERVGDRFHPHVVFEAPGFVGRLVGRDACLSTYRDFVDQAEILRFEPASPAVDLYGETAMALRRLEIDYRLANETHSEAAHEAITFAHGADGWQIVWRLVASAEDGEPA